MDSREVEKIGRVMDCIQGCINIVEGWIERVHLMSWLGGYQGAVLIHCLYYSVV